jgi:hypothetical protein
MAEKRTIELEIQDNSKTLKQQYKDAVKELQNVAAAYGETSTQAVEAAKKAAGLKDQIEDTNDLLQSYKGEGAFIAMGKAMSSVASGFSAVEGGLGLLGVESEKLQETMLRVQSAMALAQGLEGLEDAGRAFKNLQTVATDAFKGMTTAGKAFAVTGIGLLITGIGLLISNWDKVSEYIGITNKEQEKFNQQQKRTIQDAKEMRESVSKESAAFVGYISQLKATNKGTKERKDLITEINKKYGTTLKNLSDEAEFQAQLNKEVKNYLEYQKAKFTLQKNEEKITKNLEAQDSITTKLNKQKRRQIEIEKELEVSRKSLSSASRVTTETQLFSQYDKLQEKINSLNAEYKQGKTSIIEYSDSLKNAEKRLDSYGKSSLTAQGEINKLTYNGKKYVEQSTENATTETKTITEVADLKQQIYEEEIKQIQDLNAQQQVKLINDTQTRIKEVENSTATAEQKAKLIKLIQENLNKDLEKLDAEYYAKEAEAKEEANKLRIQQEAEFQAQIEEIDESNFQARLKKSMSESDYEKELVRQKYFALEEAAKGNAEQEKIIAEAKAKEIEDIDKKSKEKQIQQENELRQKRLQLTASAFTAIGDLIGSFATKSDKDARKQFQIQKAFNLASAVTNTALAVTGALTAGGNPIKLATGTQFVEAGIAATVGAANIVKIASSKFGSGSSGGGGGATAGGGGAQMAAPQFNTIGSSGINQLATLQQQPVQAYVVSGEVTSAQSLDRNRVQNATL